ncbi:MAG: hypothetical protein ABJ004_13555 [Cyclobacteriaceae bacterium]
MSTLQISYSEKNPNIWQRSLNLFEDLLGTPLGIILVLLIVIPWIILMLVFYSIPLWIYDKIRGNKYEKVVEPEEHKGWEQYNQNDKLIIEREFYEGIEEIEGRDDYKGKPYDWEGFVGFKIRTTPSNKELENMLFGYNMEVFNDMLYTQYVNYHEKNCSVVSIDLKTGDIETIKQLDRNYWLTFKKFENSLLITGENRRKKVELEIKRS